MKKKYIGFRTKEKQNNHNRVKKNGKTAREKSDKKTTTDFKLKKDH
jgi:hypothetical protein